jgi:hypothetical protein
VGDPFQAGAQFSRLDLEGVVGLLEARAKSSSMIFLKSVIGGIVCATAMWVVVVCAFTWRTNGIRRQNGITGLGAVAEGWGYLLRMPLVAILLTAAFGAGLYLTARWISN